MYTIAQAKSDFAGRLHGTSLNKITNLNELMNRAGRRLFKDHDLQEAIRIQTLVNALFDQVYDIALPADVKSNRIIDIRPQAEYARSLRDNLDQRYSKQFSLYKQWDQNYQPTFNVRNNSGVRSLRVAKSAVAGILIHPLTSITGTGTWAASGVGSGLLVDNINYVTGGASLLVNATGSGNIVLTNSTIPAIDFTQAGTTSYVGNSSLFKWVYMPDASKVTGVNLQWGSSPSNYYTKTVVAGAMGNAFVTGWNLLRFDWSGLTPVGSPVATAYTYAQITISVTSALTGYRVDNIIAQMPTLYEMEYYSFYPFNDAVTGAWKELFTSDNDFINVGPDSYEIFLDQCEVLALQQMQDAGASVDIQTAKDQLATDLIDYQSRYPSQITQVKQKYYRMPQFNYRNFIRRG
jgi:hypothetical protein